VIIKLLNKGWFLAKLTLYYKVDSSNGETLKQTVSIPINKEHIFKLPYDTDLKSTYLIAHAVAGKNIMIVQIKQRNECFHIWGTSLNSIYSSMPCW